MMLMVCSSVASTYIQWLSSETLYLMENAKQLYLLMMISQTYYQDINNTKFLMANMYQD